MHDEVDEEDVNDEDALGAAAVVAKPEDVDAEDEEAPLPVPPKKMTTSAAKVVKKVVKPGGK